MGHPVRRKRRRLVQFRMSRRRVRIPRGWVGLVFLMFHMLGVMLGFTIWLFVIAGQVTWWGISDLAELLGRRSPGLPPVPVHALADFYRMTPLQFEQALAGLCQRDGCTQVQVVGGAGDLGADVLATTPDGRRMLIQAKRYAPTNKVGSPEVQKVGGTYAVVHHAQLAAVVTTSGFTPAAVGYARQAGIRLFGARELAGWMSRTGPAPWH